MQRGRLDALEQHRRVRPAQAVGKCHDAAPQEQQSRQVERGNDRAASLALGPGIRPVGKDEREMQKERRQQEPRDRVRPVEEVVEPIVAAARREGEDAEERDGEPEEVQRRRIVRPAQPDGGADDDREHADQRERVVEPLADGRHRLKLDRNRALVAPLRIRTYLKRPPTAAPCKAASTCAFLMISSPFSVTRTSRGRMPARSAADPGATSEATTFVPFSCQSTPSSGSPGQVLTNAMLSTARQTNTAATATGRAT